MKDKLRKLADNIAEQVKNEQEYRKKKKKELHRVDFIRSLEREYTLREVLVNLEIIMGETNNLNIE